MLSLFTDYCCSMCEGKLLFLVTSCLHVWLFVLNADNCCCALVCMSCCFSLLCMACVLLENSYWFWLFLTFAVPLLSGLFSISKHLAQDDSCKLVRLANNGTFTVTLINTILVNKTNVISLFYIHIQNCIFHLRLQWSSLEQWII